MELRSTRGQPTRPEHLKWGGLPWGQPDCPPPCPPLCPPPCHLLPRLEEKHPESTAALPLTGGISPGTGSRLGWSGGLQQH